MKNILIAAVILLTLSTIACGSARIIQIDPNATPTPVSDPTPVPVATPVVITASDVFNTGMIGQTWTFVNAYGEHTYIQVEAAPFCVFNICDGKTITFHFTKDNIAAYWNPGKDCQLWFFLHLDSDGAYRSIGWQILQDGIETTSNLTLLAGWTGAPYTIIPSSSQTAAINTAYEGFTQAGFSTNIPVVPDSTWTSTWTTYPSLGTITTPMTGTVNTLVSKQCEGGHSGACDLVVETWHFCKGIGLCAILPASGLTGPVDPNLAIYRIN